MIELLSEELLGFYVIALQNLGRDDEVGSLAPNRFLVNPFAHPRDSDPPLRRRAMDLDNLTAD